jgi:F0F1-type ATP synthase membrane subunit c/vacuolar-type H+-ATPase subunit K
MDDLRKAYRTTVIIGLAMMASLVIYLVIVSLIEGGTIPLGTTEVAGRSLELARFVFLGLTAVIFFVIRSIGSVILRGGGRRSPSGGAAPEPGPLVTAAVVTFGLCEVPAIFGLVLYFLGRSTSDFYLLLLVSLFFFSIHFPRFSQWEEWFKQQGGGRRT